MGPRWMLVALLGCFVAGCPPTAVPRQTAADPAVSPVVATTCHADTDCDAEQQCLKGACVRSCEASPAAPGWFSRERVQANVVLGTAVAARAGCPRVCGKPEDSPQCSFCYAEKTAAEVFKVKVLTRLSKSGTESPSDVIPTGPVANHPSAFAWPTAAYPWPTTPTTGWSTQPDLVASNLANAQAYGLRELFYQFDASDHVAAAKHPEWVCKTVDGALALGSQTDPRGHWLDFSTGYGDIYQKQLLELTDRGGSGFLFDVRHVPESGCFGTEQQRSFVTAGGTVPTDIEGDDYHRFLRFQARNYGDRLAGWKEAVRSSDAGTDSVFLVSSTYLPSLAADQHLSSMLDAADATKTEYGLWTQLGIIGLNATSRLRSTELPPDRVRGSFALTYLRDATRGRLTHVWTQGVRNADQNKLLAATIIGHGGIMNLNIPESYLLAAECAAPPMTALGCDAAGRATLASRDGGVPVPVDASRADLVAGMDFGRDLAKPLIDSVPDAEVVVLHSEGLRSTIGGTSLGDVSSWRWMKLHWPTVGMYWAAQRAGLSMGVVTDAQVISGMLAHRHVKTLVLPRPVQQFPELDGDGAPLRAPLAAAIGDFVAGGGRVEVPNPVRRWYPPRADGSTAASDLNVALDEATTQMENLRGRVGMWLTSTQAQTSSAWSFQTFHARCSGVRMVTIGNDFTNLQEWGVADGMPDSPNPRPLTGMVLHVRSTVAPTVTDEKGNALPPAVLESPGVYQVTLPAVSFGTTLRLDGVSE